MVINYAEILVKEVFDEFGKNYEVCKFENAEDDIINTVLNRMDPKYFLSTANEGEKKAYILNKQNRLQALIEITRAVEEVCKQCSSIIK